MKRLDTSLSNRPAAAFARVTKTTRVTTTADADLRRGSVAPPFDVADAEIAVLRDIEGPDAAADRVVASIVSGLRDRFPTSVGEGPRDPGAAPAAADRQGLGRAAAETILSDVVHARAPMLTSGSGAAADEVCITLVERLLEALDRDGPAIDADVRAGFEDILWAFRERLPGTG